MSWNEIKELALRGLDFGSHTCTHATLPDIPAAEARQELQESLTTLQTNLGPRRFPLSYPHGRNTESIRKLSESLGYSCAVTTVLGPNNGAAEPFALRRTVIAADDDLPMFAARLSGLTFWYGRFTSIFNPRTESGTSSVLTCDPMVAEE